MRASQLCRVSRVTIEFLEAWMITIPTTGEVEQLYSCKQLAELWGVHEFTVRRKIWEGEIKAVRIGNRVRVTASEANRVAANRV
jgi:excisionase family DNA binding protein